MTATDTNGSGKAVRAFPAGFGGVATATYQIGGAAKTDGRRRIPKQSARFDQQVATTNELP